MSDNRHGLGSFVEPLEGRWLLAVTLDADGWSVVSPSVDTRVVYVSSSAGSDANDGLSAATPVQSLWKAYSLVRDDRPDWILLKRGDAWAGGSGFNIDKDGRSAQEPLLISAYGDPADGRPTLLGGKVLIDADNVAVIGLHLQGPGKTAGPTGEGIETTWNVTRSNILLEDLLIEGHKYGLNTRLASQVTLRRSVIADNAVQGLYTNTNVDFLVEENVFDNNGTNDVMDHNIYKGGNTTNFVVRWNVLARGANFGLKWRAPSVGGLVYENVFVGNRNDMYMSLDDENAHDLLNTGVQVVGNLFTGTGRNNQQTAIGINHSRDVLVSRNIFANANHMTGASLFALTSTFEDAPVVLDGVEISDNVIANVSTNGMNLLTSNYRDLRFERNAVQLPTKRPIVFRGLYDAAQFAVGGNTYHTGAPASGWFDYLGSDLSLDQWRALTGDDSTVQQLAFPDASRTPATYNASRGGPGTLDAFLAEVRQQSRANWRTEYTTRAVLDYVRAGFGMAPISQIMVAPLGASQTTETGGTASYEVTLSRQPSSTVVIPISSSDLTEGTVSVTSLVFTPDNWDVPQIITVAGVDDTAVDGNRPYKLVLGAAQSSDTGFAGLNPADVTLTNVSDDVDTTPPGLAMNYGGSIKMIRSSSVMQSVGYDFTVLYSDAGGINVSSLMTGNIQIAGPDGYNQLPAFVSSTVQGDGTVIATYRFNSPGGTWDQGDNAFYRLKTGPTPATDAAGNLAVAATAGTMIVYITTEPEQPLMSLALAANAVTNTTILETSSSSYKFVVTYLPDEYDMKAGTIGDGDMKIVNNLGYQATAKLVARKAGRTPGSIIAKYRIVPPGGSWNSSDNTVYTVTLLNKQVRDVEGHYVPGGKLGKFRVNLLPSGGGVVITPELVESEESLFNTLRYTSETDELFNSRTRILDLA